MKKIIGIILIVVGIITTSIGPVTLLVTLINDKLNATSNVSVIGGADGPTTIFIVGKIWGQMHGTIVVGLALFVIGLLLVLVKKKQDQ